MAARIALLAALGAVLVGGYLLGLSECATFAGRR